MQDPDFKPTQPPEDAADPAGGDPSLDEAKAMFLGNPGLASVRIHTDAGTALAHRDGRVEWPSPQ